MKGKLKKLSIILIGVMVLSLSACGKDNSKEQTIDNTTTTTEGTVDNITSTTTDQISNLKIEKGLENTDDKIKNQLIKNTEEFLNELIADDYETINFKKHKEIIEKLLTDNAKNTYSDEYIKNAVNEVKTDKTKSVISNINIENSGENDELYAFLINYDIYYKNSNNENIKGKIFRYKVQFSFKKDTLKLDGIDKFQ